ncbi:hypothetical protein BZA70DRAFT_311207 [Myxozyma melibiosi]|uniref:protein-histidine N-methyltransferase n=1 Tax=Myxozyma melibiosi TaxID=54550 RepID=A0ABR1F4B4_9ASCO
MFKFDFSGEDISDTEADVPVPSSNGEPVSTTTTTTTAADASKGSEFKVDTEIHDIRDLLQSLPSRMSYSLLSVSSTSDLAQSSKLRIPRREVFDIKVQIMADEDLLPSISEETTTKTETAADNTTQFRKKELQILLSNTEDLRTDLYEGGLKSWEGAGDLTEFLADTGVEVGKGVLELGCGSALPSIYLFQEYIRTLLTATPEQQQQQQQQQYPPVSFIMSDYNYAVLRLMTAPNFLLAYHNVRNSLSTPTSSSDDPSQPTQTSDLDLEVTPDLVSQFFEFLDTHNISIKLISGPWNSSSFADFLGYSPASTSNSTSPTEKLPFSLVLGSETIYSVASTNAFIPILLDSVSLWNTERETALLPTAYVAAKEIYFGVGGTARQFIEDTEKAGGKVKVVKRIASGRSSGVARVIIQTTAGSKD